MMPALAEEVEAEEATRAAASPKRAALLPPTVLFCSFESWYCALIKGTFSPTPLDDDGATQGTDEAFELSFTAPAPEPA